MSKIICDVCGTRFPESAEQCPICGCVHAAGAKTVADSVILEEPRAESYEKVRGGRFSKSNVRKRNKNMVRYEMQAEMTERFDEDEEEAYSEEENEAVIVTKPRSGSNALINVLLVLVIIALFVVSGYIFVQHFLPGILAQMEPTVPTAEPTVAATAEPTQEPTEEPTVPCTGLVLTNGTTEVTLNEIGQTWLLNVEVVPADSTDGLVYTSSNEAVALVDASGCITAVGEGEAVVTVVCGSEQIAFQVVCATAPETEPPTEAPTEAPTEPPKAVTLQVDRTDMTFRRVNEQTQMKLYNGLTAEEVTWKSNNEGIVKVSANGVITCVGWGTTQVVVTYGDQQVTIICRCVPSGSSSTPSTTPTTPAAPGATEAPAAPVETAPPATEAPATPNDGIIAVG